MKPRHILFPLLLILVVVAGFWAARTFIRRSPALPTINQPTKIVPQIPNVGDIVYVAVSGKDVTCHRANCPRLPQGGRPITLREAVEQGYKLCDLCLAKEREGQGAR